MWLEDSAQLAERVRIARDAEVIDHFEARHSIEARGSERQALDRGLRKARLQSSRRRGAQGTACQADTLIERIESVRELQLVRLRSAEELHACHTFFRGFLECSQHGEHPGRVLREVRIECSPIRTTAWGSIKSPAELPVPRAEDFATQELAHEPDSLKIAGGLPTLRRDQLTREVA